MKHLLTCVALLLLLATAAAAPEVKPGTAARAEDTQAYRMLRARRAAAEAEFERMLATHTRSFPGVLSKQFELDVIAREAARILSTEPALLGRLSAAYGDIVLRRVALAVEVRDALTTHPPGHPLVREKLSALSKAEGEALEQMR